MRKVRVKNRLAKVVTKDSDIPVRNDLAVTPAQMQVMAANGVAISSQRASDFNDGDTNASFDIPLEQIRGLDIVDYWELQKDSRNRVKMHIEANAKKYGDSTISKS